MLLVPSGRRRSRDRSIAALPSRMVWSVSLIVIGASALKRCERAVGAADARLRLARALGARDIALRFGDLAFERGDRGLHAVERLQLEGVARVNRVVDILKGALQRFHREGA